MPYVIYLFCYGKKYTVNVNALIVDSSSILLIASLLCKKNGLHVHCPFENQGSMINSFAMACPLMPIS